MALVCSTRAESFVEFSRAHCGLADELQPTAHAVGRNF